MAALDWSQCPAVESIPGKVSGAWVLKGTRMPVSVIFENLKAGANIDELWNASKVWTANKSKPLSNLPPAALKRLLPLLSAANARSFRPRHACPPPSVPQGT